MRGMRGDGILKIEMHFCPMFMCPMRRARAEDIIEELLKLNIKANLFMTFWKAVEEGVSFSSNIPKIRRKLEKTLYEVGLGYNKIGQPATTLSGGEAQRVKLATELSKRSTGRTIYILDEPTTGLHTADVHKLIDVLQKLADGGNTVLVIEA